MVDDPLSALDNEMSEMIIQSLTTGKLSKRTRLVVTHKKELVNLADKVYYMNSDNKLCLVDKQFVDKYFEDASSYDNKNNATKQDAVIKVDGDAAAKKKVQEDQALKNLVNTAEGMTLKAFIKAVKEMKG